MSDEPEQDGCFGPFPAKGPTWRDYFRWVASDVERRLWTPMQKLPPSTRPEDLEWLAQREAARQARLVSPPSREGA